MAADFVGLGNGITELQDRTTQLKYRLLEVRDMNNDNRKLVDEVTMFTETLDVNLQFLTANLPPNVSSKALGALMHELKEANKFMADALEERKFESSWRIKEAESRLESRRQRLVVAFQLAFIIISLDVASGGYRTTNDFQERLQ
ncbi:hypothetical protein R1sor_020868 [Riccia sorocarpa]|uniref:Uncharacterized protein n=1 Tax=Riccia sorocarpa TaxID=122646 RepID=A0ABD3GFF0_9MARC